MAPLSWDTASQAYIRGDYETALRQWRPLAENGHDNPQHGLGEMYAEGKGVPQDYVLAHMWFNLAVSRGFEEASESRDHVASKMTLEQIAEAQKLARKWRPGKSQSQIENLVEGMVLDNLIPPWLQRVLGAVPITE